MMTRYCVWLDGLALHEIDPAIYITDIQEQPAQMNVQTVPRANGDGLFVARRNRDSISVLVKLAIREYDVALRKGIMQKIVTWARAGKYLSINDRPGQRLRVTVDTMPTITSALKWTQELSIVFTAYALPYWENEEPETLTTSGTASMVVPGDAERALVDVTIVPTGNTVTVSAGNTSITLNGVSDVVEISHGDDGILRIVSQGESILSKRTPESTDDLLAVPGQENAFAASGCVATFRVRGVWA